jgi:hypothetical protein
MEKFGKVRKKMKRERKKGFKKQKRVLKTIRK